MEPTIKQLQDTIAQLNEALDNWDYVVVQDGALVQLPITKKVVDANRGLCFAFFRNYPDWFVAEMWSQLKNPEGTLLCPVGGFEEFASNPNRWANPKRKELAERCVAYLQAKLEAALLKEEEREHCWDAIAAHLDETPCMFITASRSRGDSCS